jgi:hypothetical protein
MKSAARALVRSRADQRCEYCRFREIDVYAFHVEHIIALKHGGTNDPTNLAWSCHYCNLCKSSNLSGLDPDTGRIVALFNPRRQNWKRHFALSTTHIVGLTPCRATVAVLNINATHRLQFRGILIYAGMFSTV